MQLELGTAAAPAPPAPAVLALCFPDLGLQLALRAREASGGPARPRAPVAVERDGRVVACDAEARARGVRAGDGLAEARAACAELEVATADDRGARAALEGVAEALLAIAPAVELAPPDALLLDASGAHLLAPGPADAERALLDHAVALAARLGLRCRGAVARGRGPARALARYGRSAADGAAVESLLAPLPLSALDLDPSLAARLAALGLRQVGDLAALPAATLAHRFGAAGLAAWRLARGDDPSRLVPHVPEALPEERLDLEAPADRAEAILFALRRLCERVAARLGGRGLGATRLVLRLGLDPRGEERLDVALARPSSAASRWLLVVRERLDGLTLPAPVVAVALGVGEAAPAPPEQLALGDRPEQLAALDAVLARLAARLGDEALFAAEPADVHRPEAAYRRAGFAAGGGRGRGAGGGSITPAAPRSGAHVAGACDAHGAGSGAPPGSSRPTRLLPRPEPVVAVGEGGRLTALRLRGRLLRVLELSAPERLAGEWWAEPFDRDYHRARLEALGECWIFRDAADGRLYLHGLFD